MARFDRLEFEQPTEPPQQTGPVLTPRDERHWLKLADENRRQGLYENALRFYSRALEVDKALIDAWLGQVQMLVLLGEYPEAELWSRKTLELFKNHGELLAARGQALCRAGKRKDALACCDAALAQAGQSAYRWMVRGELMVAGKEDIDRHCFDKAVQADADWLVPLEIALIYQYYGLPSKAVARARQAVEKAPDSGYAWYVQACCEDDLGLTGAARTSLRRCLELVPGHREAQQRLTTLTTRGFSLGRFIRRWFHHE